MDNFIIFNMQAIAGLCLPLAMLIPIYRVAHIFKQSNQTQ